MTSKQFNASFASALERLLDVCILTLVTISFVALAGTGKLDVISLAAVSSAILLRVYFLLRSIERQIAVVTTTKLTIAYAFIYAIDFLALSRNFISATVHLVLFLLVVKLFSVHRDRDRMYLTVISFLMLLAAAILTIDAFYLLAFIVFSSVAIATFIVMEMRRSMQSSQTVITGTKIRLARSVTGTAFVLIVAILLFTPFLFFALPRVSAGRLSQFAQQNAFTTGFGDEVTLGQIGRIQQSDAVVMRAQFDRTPPSDLKWHGTTLMNFDGRRWFNRRTEERTIFFRGSIDNTVNLLGPQARLFLDGVTNSDLVRGVGGLRNRAAQYLSFHVNLEPIGANLFFYPSRLVSIRGVASRDYLLNSNAVLTYRDEVANVVRSYSGVSLIGKPGTSDASEAMDGRMVPYLELPTMDQRVSDLAHKITSDKNTPYFKAEALESYLRTNFGYTLEMQASSDPISFFLFERKKGHCEYFASAMAVMLRTIGIPSRMVNGFRNGERSEITGSYLIRARDAHSWVEAFIPGRGWVEFDPTPSGDPPPKTFWSRVNLYIDAAREFWADWIINYDFSHQNVLAEITAVSARKTITSAWHALEQESWGFIARMQNWLSRGRQSGKYEGAPSKRTLLLLSIATTLALVGFWLRRRACRLAKLPSENVASLWLQRLIKRMARKGFVKAPAQTVTSWATSVDDELLRPKLEQFVHEYEKARFGSSQESAGRLPELYQEVEEVLKS